VIVCDQCGHRWQGYTTNGGRKRIDGSKSITEYYACGGYVMKGSSVCHRQMIRRDVLERLVISAIEETTEAMLDEAKRSELRSTLRQYLGADKQGAEQELAALHAQRDESRAKINSILDNITSTNRESADDRIGQLKKELLAITPRIEELEQAAGAAVDLDAATTELPSTLQSLARAMQEGSTDERRVVVRALVREIRLHPGKATGRAEVFSLPEFTLDARHEPAIATPAVPGVRTAPRAIAETVPGFVIDFTWSITEIHVTARGDAHLPVRCPRT
jgi:hypothetical protein